MKFKNNALIHPVLKTSIRVGLDKPLCPTTVKATERRNKIREIIQTTLPKITINISGIPALIFKSSGNFLFSSLSGLTLIRRGLILRVNNLKNIAKKIKKKVIPLNKKTNPII